MNIDKAIEHAFEVSTTCENASCALEHVQLAFWLKQLKELQSILGYSYDLDRLKELAEADKEGRCLVLPCKVGELPDEDITIPEIQILKKPAKCKVGYCQSNSAGYSYVLETKYHCPTCGVVVSEYTDFCPLCRQLLEWNKEEENE